jgi:CRP-like cAMP-binding protein
MMDEEILNIAALLKREYPFQGLSTEQLIALAEKFDIRRLGEGATLLGPKQTINKFYIVFEGQVQIEMAGRRGEKIIKILNPGDYFGDEVMLVGHGPHLTVNAVSESTLLSLEEEQFDSLMKEHPTVHTALDITMHSRRLARSPRFSWIEPDESVFLILRKHVYFLLLSLIFPIVLIVGSMVLLGIGIANTAFLLAIGLVTFGLGIFLFFWNWKDWGNDYYIVTNQRVVWIEKIILLYDSREEAALYNVLNERINTSWLGRILKFGDVFANTYTGEIAMRRTDNYLVLYSYIEGLRNRAKQMSRQLEEKQMEDALAEALRKRHVIAPEDVIPSIPAPPPFSHMKEKKTPKKKQGVGRRWENFLKYRYEQDGIITYRKALPILIGKIWLPLLLLFFWIVGIYGLWQLDGTNNLKPIGIIVMGVSLFVLLFWLGYNYVDWRNDIYQLTPTKIIDIEKRPLGAEKFNSADIENILTITHQMNFIGNLFNFGNVIVTVGMTEFVFLNVHNPSRVHQEVSNKQEALRRLKKQAEEARERERMINWLVAYSEETGKN